MPVAPSKRRWPSWLNLIPLLAFPLVLLFLGRNATGSMAYSELKSAINAGQVLQAEVGENVIAARLKEPSGREKWVRVARVEDPSLYADLQRGGAKVVGVPPSSFWQDFGIWLIPLAALGFYSWRSVKKAGGYGLGGEGYLAVGRSKARLYAEKDIDVRFTDVAGVDEAKEELQEVISFLKEPGRFSRVGGRLPKGILLVGPPGTGKTLLARAVAGEASVPFFSMSGSEFVELFVGVGAARVRDLFSQAKSRAPCIIFIDELDALGKVRGATPGGHDEREQTLNQLLVELDGFDPAGGVILMAATNRPEVLDPALLRAGRFDRQVLVDRPDKRGRLEILQVHAKKVKLGPDANLEAVAAMTVGMVGADMANIVNEAALLAVRRGKDLVGRAELDEAVERVITGLEKKNRVLNPLERERVAHHEVGHALVGLAFPGNGEVRKISIVPRGISALGYTLQLPTEDRFLMTRSELENKIAAALGGRVAEELIFGEVSTGAQDDLLKATRVARAMVRSFGMSPELGLVSYDEDTQFPQWAERGGYGERIAARIEREVHRILEEQHERVRGLLVQRKAALVEGARQLLLRETLSGPELREILRSVDRAA